VTGFVEERIPVRSKGVKEGQMGSTSERGVHQSEARACILSFIALLSFPCFSFLLASPTSNELVALTPSCTEEIDLLNCDGKW